MTRSATALVAAGLALAGLVANAQLREPATGSMFDENVNAGGTQFQCLGTGLRKVFVAKVYAMTYCLEPKAVSQVDDWVRSHHEARAATAELTKALRGDGDFYYQLARVPSDRMVVMRMVRNVSQKQLADAFTESLGKVLPAQSTAKLIALVPRDAKEGDTVVIRTKGDTLLFRIGDHENTVTDKEIAQKLWDVWLSPDSVAPSLKDSLADHFARSTGPRG